MFIYSVLFLPMLLLERHFSDFHALQHLAVEFLTSVAACTSQDYFRQGLESGA